MGVFRYGQSTYAGLDVQAWSPYLYQNELTSGSSGNSTSITITQTPQKGQLLLAAIQISNSDGTDPHIVTPAGWTGIGSEQQCGTTDNWCAAFWKIASGSETSVPCSWGGANTNAFYAEVDEYRGFVYGPVFDQFAAAGGTVNTLGSSGTTSSALAYPSEFVWSAASWANNNGGLTTGLSVFEGRAPFQALNLAGIANLRFLALGWTVGVQAVSAATDQWVWKWTTARAWTVVGATFKDGPAVVQATVAETGHSTDAIKQTAGTVAEVGHSADAVSTAPGALIVAEVGHSSDVVAKLATVVPEVGHSADAVSKTGTTVVDNGYSADAVSKLGTLVPDVGRSADAIPKTALTTAEIGHSNDAIGLRTGTAEGGHSSDAVAGLDVTVPEAGHSADATSVVEFVTVRETGGGRTLAPTVFQYGHSMYEGGDLYEGPIKVTYTDVVAKLGVFTPEVGHSADAVSEAALTVAEAGHSADTVKKLGVRVAEGPPTPSKTFQYGLSMYAGGQLYEGGNPYHPRGSDHVAVRVKVPEIGHGADALGRNIPQVPTRLFQYGRSMYEGGDLYEGPIFNPAYYLPPLRLFTVTATGHGTDHVKSLLALVSVHDGVPLVFYALAYSGLQGVGLQGYQLQGWINGYGLPVPQDAVSVAYIASVAETGHGIERVFVAGLGPFCAHPEDLVPSVAVGDTANSVLLADLVGAGVATDGAVVPPLVGELVPSAAGEDSPATSVVLRDEAPTATVADSAVRAPVAVDLAAAASVLDAVPQADVSDSSPTTVVPMDSAPVTGVSDRVPQAIAEDLVAIAFVEDEVAPAPKAEDSVASVTTEELVC